jgi:hypothetical protein
MKENQNKIANCFRWTDDLNKIVGTLILLKNNDINFHKKIKVMNGEYDKNNNTEMIELKKNENEKINEYVKVKCMSLNDIWEMKKNLLFEFSNKNKRAPKESDSLYKNYNLNLWLQNNKRKIKNKEDNIYLKLSENNFIKINLDEYFENKNKTK